MWGQGAHLEWERNKERKVHPCFGPVKMTLLSRLAVAAAGLLVVSCGGGPGPVEPYGRGFMPFDNPLDYVRPGTIFTYVNGVEQLEVAHDVCFPEGKIRRIRGSEQLWNRR